MIKPDRLQPPVVEAQTATDHTLASVGLPRANRPLRAVLHWDGLCLIFLVLVGLLLLVQRAALSRTGRMASQFVVVIVVYGLVGLWLDWQQRTLAPTDKARKGYARTQIIYHVVLPESKLLTDGCPCQPLRLPVHSTHTDE